MTNGEFMDMVVRDLKAYKKAGVAESLQRNQHMHQWRGTEPPENLSDALLVDFVNFIGMRRGMDLGLYTKDLKGG